MPTAFVATDPETGRRLGVAWSELDASEMAERADDLLGGRMRARLDQVRVSRTPAEMREARRERERRERHEAERARVAALLRPPPGFVVRRYPPLARSTLRRPFYPGRALRRIAEAEGWMAFGEDPYGQETIPLATRGLILIADGPGRRRLCCATPAGRKRAGLPPL